MSAGQLCPGPGAKVDLSPSLQKGSVCLLALKDRRGSFVSKVMTVSLFYVPVLGVCVCEYMYVLMYVHTCIGQRSTSGAIPQGPPPRCFPGSRWLRVS